MNALALVDYDNLRGFRRKSAVDVEHHAGELIDLLVRAFRAGFPRLRELDVRFYGGWTDESGLPSRDALWLLQALPPLRGRREGLIVRPALATAMLQFPRFVLRGTVRLQYGRKRQKMVDAMLGCDAVYAAASGLTGIGVVTGDDDLLPATLSAHAVNPGATVWIRPESAGLRLNDHELAARRLPIHRLDENHAEID